MIVRRPGCERDPGGVIGVVARPLRGQGNAALLVAAPPAPRRRWLANPGTCDGVIVMALSESVPYLLADAVRSAHSDPERLARIQRVRLRNLVRHARTASPFYRHRYRHVPAQVEEVSELPVLDKQTLMSCFDDWVTDPDVTLEDLRDNFLARDECVGQLYLGRYLVMRTSGTTGEPAILLQDRLSWRVYNIVGRTRPQPIARRIDLGALASGVSAF